LASGTIPGYQQVLPAVMNNAPTPADRRARRP
jgi:hypothetical protein